MSAHSGERQSVTVTVPTFEARDWQESDTGAWVSFDCDVCERPIADGAAMLLLDHQPVHAWCFAAQVSQSEVDQAWLTLAGEIVRRPSRFKASDVRAVVQNLIRIVAAAQAPASVLPAAPDSTPGGEK